MEDDGFVLVQRRKKKGRVKSHKIEEARARQMAIQDCLVEESSLDCGLVTRAIETCADIVASSGYKRETMELVSGCVSDIAGDAGLEILCLGIGRVGSSSVAQHQAGLLLALVNELPGAPHVQFQLAIALW